jgi:predicted RNase H-like HicB family nuclease
MKRTLTAVLIREDDGFVALCPEIDVASQGDTVEEAKSNLREAVELFFECASRMRRFGSVSPRNHSCRRWRSALAKLPRLSGEEVCRILERHGFSRVRQRGRCRVTRNCELGHFGPLFDRAIYPYLLP